ncbi:hypothetical protein VFMJ11_1287 [Aliivibrio fischeri MJ11]|uniref:Uncharacterized protein n=1 Tax=Aliivibrio fischeri (strain MJ11) TaxID=388396 RepID=B5FDU2_ALIFM|nr:hypothetical protein VFMJ11_1287 [Aliivibrio fischeri MJ11]
MKKLALPLLTISFFNLTCSTLDKINTLVDVSTSLVIISR